MISLKPKHLLSISDLTLEEIEALLDRGDYWAHKPNRDLSCSPKLDRNPIICNLFFEASTRTRFSFEVAAKRLGYYVLNFHPFNSSVQKGETLYDSIKTLEAMGVSVAVIRTPEEQGLEEIAQNTKVSIINAGDGSNQHPSQALLDLLTLRQHFGRIDGLRIAIIGDIKHSRVAQSNIGALGLFDTKILLSGPPQLLPDRKHLPKHTEIVSVDEAIENADVVMMLRVQKERHLGSLALDNYLEHYGLNKQRALRMPKHAMIMHPAPFNRGIEIDGDLVEGPRSLIYCQVSNGIAIRMAILENIISSQNA